MPRGSGKTSDNDAYQYHNSGQPCDATKQDLQIQGSLSPSRGHDGDTSACPQRMSAARRNMLWPSSRGSPAPPRPGLRTRRGLKRTVRGAPFERGLAGYLHHCAAAWFAALRVT